MQTTIREEHLLTDLAPYIRAIWKYKWLIVLVVLVSAGIGYALCRRERQVYAATADIRIGRIWNEPVIDANLLTEIINGQPFMARVNERLGRKKPAETLARAISAERLEAGKAKARYVYLVRLTGRAGNPERAQELVKAAAEQVLAESNQKFTDAFAAYAAREKELQANVEKLRGDLATANSPAALYGQRLELLTMEQQLAEVNINNSSPLKTYQTALADEIGPAQLLPRGGLLKSLIISIVVGLAVALLAVLVLEFGWPILKAKE